MPNIVAGKVAIVTGAGRGIGRGIALLLAQEGARVVVCDIGASLDGAGTDIGPAQAVVDEIKKAGGAAIASTLSISEPANAEKIVAAALEHFGRVDVLVNNAGILRDRIFHRMSWSDWSDVIDVHLHGSFAMSRACATHFREQNSGSFVHMTSTSGLVGNFGQANYMAAKMGIVGLSRGIALDMARFNVRSNCIAPFAWTRMIDSIPAQTEQEKERVARIREMLIAVGLPAMAERLDERAHWNRMLSLGEQQRLGLARAILHAPDFLFLDEATASLDEPAEAALYKLLAEKLPDTTIVSIGHRSTLEAFHQRNVTMVRDGDRFTLRDKSSIRPAAG